MSNIQKIEFKNFSWTNLTDPTEKEMTELREKYKFHPLDIADCLSLSHRSKADVYSKYTFIVMLFPIFDPQTREINSAELDIFISNDYLITVHKNELKTFNDFFDLFRLSSDSRDKYGDKSPEKLLYDILSKLNISILPMVDHLNDDCDHIEKAIFSGQERKMVSEILIIRRNITDCRKIMQAHKNVLKKMIYNFKENPLYVMKKTDVYFENLVDHTKEIWDSLENLKERIEAIQQTNESQISFRLSDIMRILTIISVLTLPINLLATTFGMNTTNAMPFTSDPYGFWHIVGIMAALLIIMLAIFKKNKWL